LLKYKFSSISFKNWNLTCCNKTKCEPYSDVKFSWLDRFILNAIIFDLVHQYYWIMIGENIKYDVKLIDYVNENLNNWKILDKNENYSVFLTDDWEYLTINLYQKWVVGHSYSIESEIDSKNLTDNIKFATLKNTVDSFLKKRIKNELLVKSKDTNTKAGIHDWLIMLSDDKNSLLLGCSCVGWISHTVLFQKDNFEWSNYLTIVPYFNCEYIVWSDRVIDNILLSEKQVTALNLFLNNI
jgi:hypothetical protein